MTRTFNQDCMVAMREMKDNEFDLAIVDPPYGAGHNFGGRPYAQIYNEGNKWNEAPSEQYFIELKRISVNYIIWGGNYFGTLWPVKSFIIWDKKQPEGISFAMVELAVTSFDKSAQLYTSITLRNNRIHPTQKPIALYKWLLKNYAKDGDTILDTHLGSGSSRVAAHDMGFDFTGYEIDKDYFEAQELRFNNHISQQSMFDPKDMYQLNENN